MKYKIVIEQPAEKFIVKHPRLPCPNTTEMAGVFCTPNTMWGSAFRPTPTEGPYLS